jgi:hypothetical protein
MSTTTTCTRQTQQEQQQQQQQQFVPDDRQCVVCTQQQQQTLVYGQQQRFDRPNPVPRFSPCDERRDEKGEGGIIIEVHTDVHGAASCASRALPLLLLGSMPAGKQGRKREKPGFNWCAAVSSNGLAA